MPTSESPKVMGLMGICDPDALQHYTGYTYCSWCRKEGQNEGTVVNHLRTTHYRLGLMCDQCFGCPSVMSDSLCQHVCQDCQQYSVPSGSGLSSWPTFQTKGSYKGVKAVLFNQTPFLLEGWKIQQRRCHLLTHLTHLLFSCLTDKQLLPSWLLPDLLRNDTTDNIKHTHPNWLQLRWCLQELIKTTRSNNTSNSWINSFNYTVYWNFLVSTTVTISSKYVYQLSAVIVESGVFLRGPHIPPPLFVLRSMTLCTVIYSLAAWKGIMPPLFNQCRYLSVGRSIPCQCGRPMALHSNTLVTYPFYSPSFHLFGLACHDPVQWVVAFLFWFTIHQCQWV